MMWGEMDFLIQVPRMKERARNEDEGDKKNLLPVRNGGLKIATAGGVIFHVT